MTEYAIDRRLRPAFVTLELLHDVHNSILEQLVGLFEDYPSGRDDTVKITIEDSRGEETFSNLEDLKRLPSDVSSIEFTYDSYRSTRRASITLKLDVSWGSNRIRVHIRGPQNSRTNALELLRHLEDLTKSSPCIYGYLGHPLVLAIGGLLTLVIGGFVLLVAQMNSGHGMPLTDRTLGGYTIGLFIGGAVGVLLSITFARIPYTYFDVPRHRRALLMLKWATGTVVTFMAAGFILTGLRRHLLGW
jgi:hypothetical protein